MNKRIKDLVQDYRPVDALSSPDLIFPMTRLSSLLTLVLTSAQPPPPPSLGRLLGSVLRPVSRAGECRGQCDNILVCRLSGEAPGCEE